MENWICWGDRPLPESVFILKYRLKICEDYCILLPIGRVPSDAVTTLLEYSKDFIERSFKITAPDMYDQLAEERAFTSTIAPVSQLSKTYRMTLEHVKDTGSDSPFLSMLKQGFNKLIDRLQTIERADFEEKKRLSGTTEKPSVTSSKRCQTVQSCKAEGKVPKCRATKKEIEKAKDFLLNYFQRKNVVDFMQGTIHLKMKEELGHAFNLSKKTEVGKFYAVLYYNKKKTPPKGWTKDEINTIIKGFAKEAPDFWGRLK